MARRDLLPVSKIVWIISLVMDLAISDHLYQQLAHLKLLDEIDVLLWIMSLKQMLNSLSSNLVTFVSRYFEAWL